MGWRAIALSGLAFLAACGGEYQSPSQRVGLIEVPLASKADRQAFLTILIQTARAQEVRVDLDFHDPGSGALDTAFWVGEFDSAGMVLDLKSRAWVIFLKSQQPAKAAAYHNAITAKFKQRWPATKAIPVTPEGPLPRIHS